MNRQSMPHPSIASEVFAEQTAALLARRHGAVHFKDTIVFPARAITGTLSVSIQVERTVVDIARCEDEAVLAACRTIVEKHGDIRSVLHAFGPVEWHVDADGVASLMFFATDVALFADTLLVLRDAALAVISFAEGLESAVPVPVTPSPAALRAMDRDPFFPSEPAVHS